MAKIMLALVFALALPISAFSQEKTIDNISVFLGVLSWRDIKEGIGDKQGAHTREYHRKMADEMAKMHGGGGEGTYHILIVLQDKTSGKRVKDAEVEATARTRTGGRFTKRMQLMSMNEFSGFGEYFRLDSEGPYVVEVKVSLAGKRKPFSVRFEGLLPPK